MERCFDQPFHSWSNLVQSTPLTTDAPRRMGSTREPHFQEMEFRCSLCSNLFTSRNILISCNFDFPNGNLRSSRPRYRGMNGPETPKKGLQIMAKMKLRAVHRTQECHQLPKAPVSASSPVFVLRHPTKVDWNYTKNIPHSSYIVESFSNCSSEIIFAKPMECEVISCACNSCGIAGFGHFSFAQVLP